MPEIFPFSDVTANELTFTERDALYTALHDRPETTARHQYGPQLVWKHADVREVLRAESPDISNAQSLDPLDGFGAILRNPRTIRPFAKHLIPLPARATANASGSDHRLTWTTMTDFFMKARLEQADALELHFQGALRELGHTALRNAVDVTQLSIQYATRVTGDAVGLDRRDWPQVAAWSKAQSGLLGQRLRGSGQAEAVEGLGELFTISKHIVRAREKAPRQDLASRLVRNGVEHRVAVAAVANCLAAGVHTIAGTLQQGTQRLLHPDYRTWWDKLDSNTESMHIAQKILQLDPGLVGWKRTVTTPTTLQSGTQLKKGEVVAMFAAANRDPAEFPDPYNVAKRAPLLTFGSGDHVCPGRNLATTSTWVFLRNLHRLAPDAEIMPQTAQPRPRDLLFSGADVTIANVTHPDEFLG
jgi:cytochrome P450